jgi:hypothetical protein
MWVASVGLFRGKLDLVSENNTLLLLSFSVVPARKFHPVAWLPGYRCWTRCDLVWLNTCHSRVRFSILSFEEHERCQEILRVLTRGHPNHVFRRVGKIAKSDCLFRNVRLSGRVDLFGSHCTDFLEIWYLRPFRKSVERIQVSLKSDKHNGYITRRHMYIYNSLISSQIDKCLR